MVKPVAQDTTTNLVPTSEPTPTSFSTLLSPPQPHAGGLRTIAEITAALEQEVTPDIIMKLDDYDYIPWNEAVRVANRIFGVAGWDNFLLSSRLESVPNDQGELTHGYATLMRIVVYPADTRAFRREGLGFSELIFSKPKGEKGGTYYKPATALIDSSIKGSASRALLRTLVLMGEQFGLSFYDKKDTQASTGAVQRTTAPSTGTSTPPTGGTSPLSPGQVSTVAKKFNTTEEAVVAATSTISQAQARAAIDKLFGGEAPWKLSAEFGGLEYVKRGSSTPSTGTRDRLPIPV